MCEYVCTAQMRNPVAVLLLLVRNEHGEDFEKREGIEGIEGCSNCLGRVPSAVRGSVSYVRTRPARDDG